MANKEAWKNRHNWYGNSHGTERSKVSVFVQSDEKDDGTLHPAKVNLKGYYKAKDGKEHIHYVDIPAYMLPGVIADLQKAQKINEDYFKGQVSTRSGPEIKVPEVFGKKTSAK